MDNNRIEDERKEQVVNAFLEEIFYNVETVNYVKKTDKESQVKGIDTTFTFDGRNYLCDEKAAVNYVNRDFKLNTFCLELSALNKLGKEFMGWFLDPKKENDSYIFVWLDKARSSKLVAPGDIYRAEMALVSRIKLIELLFSRGLTEQRVYEIMKGFREDKNFGTEYGPHKNRYVIQNGIKFTFSPSLKEKPINLLIGREDLKSIADYRRIYIK